MAVAMKAGCIFMCKVGWLDCCSSPGEAEMHGVLAGIELALALCVHEAEFVSDSVEVVGSLAVVLAAKGGPLLCGMRASQHSLKAMGGRPDSSSWKRTS